MGMALLNAMGKITCAKSFVVQTQGLPNLSHFDYLLLRKKSFSSSFILREKSRKEGKHSQKVFLKKKN
jgi:hypothetical protein